MIYLVIVGGSVMQHVETTKMNKPSLHTEGQFILYLQGLSGCI